MAIDYKKEWRDLRRVYGSYLIQNRRQGVVTTPTTLGEVMDFQIDCTIKARESKMKEYIKATIETDIGKTNEKVFNVKIFYHAQQCGTVAVNKEAFEAWCRLAKGGKK